MKLVDIIAGHPYPGSCLARLKYDDPKKIPRQVQDLFGILQSAEFHPEGDAFVHTCCTMDAMADLLRNLGDVGHKEKDNFVLAMMCHDLGKAKTTIQKEKNGFKRWTAPGHDVAGVPIACAMLERMGVSFETIAWILPLVRYHMTHARNDNYSVKSVRKLARNLAPAAIADLLLVMEADCNGRPPMPKGLPPRVNDLIDRALELGVMHRPRLAVY